MSRDKYLDQVVLVGSKKSIQSKDNATAFIIEIPCIEKPTFSFKCTIDNMKCNKLCV